MKKPLLDVIFASEKRKQVLLLLQDGAKEMEAILNSLNTTRQALLPQMKVLEEHHLVSHYDDTYELTTIGKPIVDNMKSIIDKTGVFDTDIDYWGTHELTFIPSHLLKRINELENCEVVSPPITDLYSFHKSFKLEDKEGSPVYIVTTFLYPDFYSIFTELLERNVTAYYIVSQELLDKIRDNYSKEFAELIKDNSFKMYVYNKKMKFLFFIFNAVHLLISMLKQNGKFDHKFVLSTNTKEFEWAKELFEYYLKDSMPITQI